MRVDGAITYDVSKGHLVEYVGVDSAGTKVYFLSDQSLTADDLDTSKDLYLWSQASDSLTLVSKGDNPGNPGEPGNSDECAGGMYTQFNTLTTDCGVATYTQWNFCSQPGGGNCLSDNSIASETGDIYFFSQELLDGTRGIPNQTNLYVFRKGAVQYVATPDRRPGHVRAMTSFPGAASPFPANAGVTRRRNTWPSSRPTHKSPSMTQDGLTEMYKYSAEHRRNWSAPSCMPER